MTAAAQYMGGKNVIL